MKYTKIIALELIVMTFILTGVAVAGSSGLTGHWHFNRSEFVNGGGSANAITGLWSEIIVRESKLKSLVSSGQLQGAIILASEIKSLTNQVAKRASKNPARMSKLKSILKRASRIAGRISKVANNDDLEAS
ncbi:MAG: hypothetical protein ACI9CF_001690, partial [Candidatus Omnitrophota bacterium]